MDFTLDDDQAMVKALAERFVADRYTAGARAGYRTSPCGYAPANWALLAELGLFAIAFDEADGGLGGGTVEVAAVMEAFGKGLVCEPFLADVLLGGGLLAQAGTVAQKDTWIAQIIAGEAHVGFAYAEHGGRFDLDRIETRYDGGRLTGTKTAVEGGGDAYVVTARDGDRVRLALVAGDAPGLSRRTYRLVDGAVAHELTFDAALAEPMDGGSEVLAKVIDRARIAAVTDMIGSMDSLFITTLDYVKQRRQFGAPIGSFQALQHRLADQYAALEQARSHSYAALTGDPAAIAAAKSYVSAAAIRLGEECIQLHGGMGVSDELDIGHWHKRVLRLAILFGDAPYEQARYDRLRRGAAAA
ncbi:MAG TPA: acyl-CoA dehydrogenase family protein [Sphingomonas sp.]